MEHFDLAWSRRYGRRYPFNFGKDGSHFRWMILQVKDIAELEGIIDRYLANDEPFFMKVRHTLGLLRQNWVQFSTEESPSRPPPPSRPDPATMDLITSLRKETA
jgi:hypothetical protein